MGQASGGHTHQGDVLCLRHQEHDEEGHQDHPAGKEEEDAKLHPNRATPKSAAERHRRGCRLYMGQSRQP